MGHIPHLGELAVIAGLGVLVSVVLARFRLPTVTGLLLAGALAGPHGLGLVGSSEGIAILAEIGVVFLLFSIGLEFSLARLRSIFEQVALGGSIQVGLTTLVAAGVALALGRPLPAAILYGFVFALSSTAIVLRALAERRELDAPHGRFIVGALIFQDLCVVPMVLVVPILGAGGSPGDAAIEVGIALAKAAALVIGVVLVSRWIVPRVMTWVDASRSREVFLLAVLGICIGTAWLTSLVGLSLALGAFLGGMVVADTEFGHRAMGDVLPLRDAFVSVFFVSLGMLFEGQVVLENPLAAALLLAGFLFAKGLLATLAAIVMRFPARAAWLAGVGLAQFGEFGFVLATLGQGAGVVSADEMSILLSAGILSMFLTPLLVRAAPHVTAGERLLAPLERLLGAESIDRCDPAIEATLSGHVLVVGHGVAGRLVTEALSASGVPYVVLEMNVDTVRRARERGEPVYYGDATSEEALGHAHLADAAALVVVVNDPAAAGRVVATARRLAPELPILVRAHYLAEREAMVALGATEVVAEEVESGVEIVARALRRLEVPRNVIAQRLEQARVRLHDAMARPTTIPRTRLGESRELAALKIDSVLVRGETRAAGSTLLTLDLRKQTGALAVALRRDGALEETLRLDEPLAPGDVLYVVGSPAAIASAAAYLDEPAAAASSPS